MRESGALAETGITDSLAGWEEPYGIREKEFHAVIKRAITGDISTTVSSLLITGLATRGSAIAAGITMPFYLEDVRFAVLEKTGIQDQDSIAINSSASTPALANQAESLTGATDIVLDALVQRVATILHTSTSEIDTNCFLHSYGIDSLRYLTGP